MVKEVGEEVGEAGEGVEIFSSRNNVYINL